VIDGSNQRVGKKINGTLIQGFLYQDELSPIAELDGSNNLISRFVYATRINVPDYIIRGGEVRITNTKINNINTAGPCLCLFPVQFSK
jgi:hypothetical protein